MCMAIYTTELLTDRDYNIPEGRLPLEYAVDTANKAKAHNEDAAAHVSADSIKNIVPIAWRKKYNNDSMPNLTNTSNIGGLAIGFNAQAVYGMAIGDGATQTGSNGIAIGKKANAKGSVCIGDNSESSYTSCVAIGDRAKCDGENNSTAVGSYAQASGLCATVFGARTYANSTYGVAIGPWARSVNQGSTAVGGNANATADYAVAFGHEAQATEDSAVAIGKKSGARTPRSIAIGYNALGGGNFGSHAISIGDNAQTGNGSIAIGSNTLSDDFSLALGNNARAMPGMGTGYAIGNGANCDSFRSMAIGHGATNKVSESLLLTASNASGLNFSMQLQAGFPTGKDGDITEGAPFAAQNYLIFTVEDTLTGTKQTAMLSEINLFNMLKQFGAEVTFDKGSDGYYSGAENY